jgi:uncharacterized protein (DUF362 family)/ferredoxin
MKKKVALTECHEYSYEKVRKSLEEGIALIGGLSGYLSEGDRVMLKANLLMKKRPEEATTTHPVFMKALADIISEYGCSVVIADSPGGPFNEAALKGVYKACGYEDAFKNTDIELNYDTSEAEVFNSECKLVKKITVMNAMKNVDKVISVSKLKTHGMMKFTGAVKNMFGTIPGLIKAEYHFKMPNTYDFADMLVDVCINANPVLSFMDGIVGMEGSGPSAGNPVDIGAVIVSESPYHLDVVASNIVGIDPFDVPTVAKSIERGIVMRDMSDIEIVGLAPDSYGVENFISPDIESVEMLKGRVPRILEGALSSMLTPRPVFIREKCVGCGECKRACPPQAITMKGRFPKVELDKCIRCYCCQELCPKKAVEIHRPWLLRKIVKL